MADLTISPVHRAAFGVVDANKVDKRPGNWICSFYCIHRVSIVRLNNVCNL